MKVAKAGLAFLVSVSVFATLSSADVSSGARSGRLATPESVALELIDNSASDSWAEGGDVQRLNFTGLACDFRKGSCVLSYTIKFYGKPSAADMCKLTVSGADAMLAISKTEFELKDAFVAQVDKCMTAAGI